MRKIWPFTFYFLFYAAIACLSPFIVLYYRGLGFTGPQIGLLTGVVPLITMVAAPLWTGLADATHRHRTLMSLALLMSVVMASIFPLFSSFVPVLLLSVLLYIFTAPIVPLVDGATMFMLSEEKEMYSRIRLGGTIGFGIAGPIIGLLIENYGLRFAFWGFAFFLLLGVIVSQKFAYSQSEGDNLTWGRVRALLARPHWILFLIVAFAGGMGLAAFNNYLFPYMEELGAGESTMGLALMFGTISEIPILFFGNRLIKYLKPYGLLMLSAVTIGLRMLLFAASGTPDLVLVIQLINGLTLPAMAVAGVSYADENAPVGMSTTAQGLFSAMFSGFGTAVGGFIGGPLLESAGGRGLYLVFGVVVLVVAFAVLLIQRRLPSEQKMGVSP